MPREFFNDEVEYDDEDGGELVTLEDGYKWSKATLNDLENANWHTASEAFEPLIWLLPEIYQILESFNYHKVAKKLMKSTEKWDHYF